jgi:hypothetical protein
MTKITDSVYKLRALQLFPFLCLTFGCLVSPAQAQVTPDWMFALEGPYVGRFEQAMEGNDELVTYDARFDGLRNGKENGFVLQVAKEVNGEIFKSVQMWNWNDANQTVEIASLNDNEAVTSEWFVSSGTLSTSLTRGASEGHAAVIERWRIERLPGQLRWDKYVNFGDGKWKFRWRYVLDEVVE